MEFSVQLDGKTIGSTNDLISAVAMAVAGVNVFNIEFPKKLEKFFEFLQSEMVGIRMGKPSPAVQKLAVKLTK